MREKIWTRPTFAHFGIPPSARRYRGRPTVHFRECDLKLPDLAVFAKHGGMQRAISVWFWLRHVVLDAAF